MSDDSTSEDDANAGANEVASEESVATDGAPAADVGDADDTETGADATDDRTPGEKLAGLFEPIDRQLHRIDWYPIVTKEFTDTIRSRALVLYSLVLLAIFVIPPALLLYTGLGPEQQELSTRLLLGQAELMALVTSIAAIAFGYAAVSGERERGSIKFLLGQPYDRRDVLFGKLFGRFAAVSVPLLVAVVLRVVVILPSDADLPVLFQTQLLQQGVAIGPVAESFLLQYVVFVGMSMALALTFVGFGVGASAATSTTRRSLLIAGGIWAYLYLLWDSVARGLPQMINETIGLDASTQLHLELLLKLVDPARAYQTLLYSFGGLEQSMARAYMTGSLLLTPGQSIFQRQQVAAQLEGNLPWYLSDWVALASLVLWLVVPLGLGYWYFRSADL